MEIKEFTEVYLKDEHFVKIPGNHILSMIDQLKEDYIYIADIFISTRENFIYALLLEEEVE